ncbi:MAG: tetratricopeptide repeat protein, partial [Candidatus Eisenbacteria bacterium]|nr:tetratricopeptide repeat protein [Candidatus Eisenbacteria bacterium]
PKISVSCMKAISYSVLTIFLAGSFLTFLGGCGSRLPPPYKPMRPKQFTWILLEEDPTKAIVALLFRSSAIDSIPPPITLRRIDALLRRLHPSQIEPDAVDRLALLREEEELERQLQELHIGMGDLVRFRLGIGMGDDDTIFRRLAGILGSKAILSLHYGTVEGRIHARQYLESGLIWDPDNPILTILLSRLLKMGSYHWLSTKMLERYGRGSRGRDLMDLEQMRAWEGHYQTTLEEKNLRKAHKYIDKILERNGRRPWILLEQARLYIEGDRDTDARPLLEEALSAMRDDLAAKDETGAEISPRELRGNAYFLSATLESNRLEYDKADSLFRLAFEDLRHSEGGGYLADLMALPWDLFSAEEKLEYDSNPNRDAWLEHFWHTEDPILATPHLRENQVEYWTRIAIAKTRFDRLRNELTGPETEPGAAILRFGRPARFEFLNGQPKAGSSIHPSIDFSIFRKLIMSYTFRYTTNPQDSVKRVLAFDDGGGNNLFTCIDSLATLVWPPRVFDFSFRGLYYPMAMDAARFQEHNGTTRLIVGLETLWPNLQVPFPLSEYSFEGSLEAISTRYQMRDQGDIYFGKPMGTRELPMDRIVPAQGRGSLFQRRIATLEWDHLPAGISRVASLLKLRDNTGVIVGYSADNGDKIIHPGWDTGKLEMSDILFAAHISDNGLSERDWEIRPGVTAYGIPRDSLKIIPRGSTKLLPGEDLFILFEVYNLSPGSGVSQCEIRQILEKIRPDGTVAYSVGSADATSSLIRYGINWWVSWNGIGLSELKEGRYRLRIIAFDQNAFQAVEKTKSFTVLSGQHLAGEYPWRRLKPEEPS